MSLDLIKRIYNKLEEVIDPELGISIVDLGLIYEVKVENETAHIIMTLTTLGCPLFHTIEEDINDKLKTIKEIKDTKIELVFDPPWSMDRMTEKAKAIMGI
ncbi:MAG TPA: metal-sulfur cluster assembly factor [Candidatus Nitrosocosmicus sp.]|nr:metal-sulfur cluster assembly factor [Candidatus Nitrosocosmicus sp.]